eukprot:scaffold1405_cov305-Prasinococcus_capsulatus_cf.AAC.3
MDSVLTDIGATAVKTGMVADADVAALVACKVAQHGLPPLVVDPVMVASSGAVLVTPEVGKQVHAACPSLHEPSATLRLFAL